MPSKTTKTVSVLSDVKIKSRGRFEYVSKHGTRTSARFDLFLIREAWDQDCDFEDLADGYGVGKGTQGDWSAIRDSSPAAIDRMLQKAINFLFPNA